MQADHDKSIHAAALGQRGGQKRAERLSAAERSAISRHHPREAQAAKEQAQELAYLIQQAIKNGRQLPLV